MRPVHLTRPARLQRSSLLLDHHAAQRQPPRSPLLQRFLRQLPRALHASRPARAFGFKLPEPSNEPLAGTVADGSGPPWLFLLQVLVGLPTALWAYKCLMLVLFQRRIIYLPSVPPGTRDQSVPHQTGDLVIKEVQLQSTEPSRWLRRPVKLSGIEVEWRRGTADAPAGPERRVVIVYLQGNAGTPLLRLPVFRKLLRPEHPTSRSSQPRITLLAVAPRSYWLSDRTTPTQRGVLADYRAALANAQARYGSEAIYVLYGHSLGGAAAILLLLRQLDRLPHIAGLVLENPLPSIPYMVRALYPQRWLPYHYLGPFAFDKWDALSAVEQEVRQGASGRERRKLPPTSLWIRSGRDEIIPHGADSDGVKRMYAGWTAANLDMPAASSACGEAESDRALLAKQVRPPPRQADGDDQEVEPVARDHGSGLGRAQWIDVPHALHDTAYMEQRWRDGIRGFVDELSSASGRKAGS